MFRLWLFIAALCIVTAFLFGGLAWTNKWDGTMQLWGIAGIMFAFSIPLWSIAILLAASEHRRVTVATLLLNTSGFLSILSAFLFVAISLPYTAELFRLPKSFVAQAIPQDMYGILLRNVRHAQLIAGGSAFIAWITFILGTVIFLWTSRKNESALMVHQ
jgi:hypothetical protein